MHCALTVPTLCVPGVSTFANMSDSFRLSVALVCVVSHHMPSITSLCGVAHHMHCLCSAPNSSVHVFDFFLCINLLHLAFNWVEVGDHCSCTDEGKDTTYPSGEKHPC